MPRLLELIASEATHAAKGRAAHLILKLNALTEPTLIRALYQASMAGVQIDLIVRGSCGLRPGVAGVSESIRVCSIIGRFLAWQLHADGRYQRVLRADAEASRDVQAELLQHWCRTASASS